MPLNWKIIPTVISSIIHWLVKIESSLKDHSNSVFLNSYLPTTILLEVRCFHSYNKNEYILFKYIKDENNVEINVTSFIDEIYIWNMTYEIIFFHLNSSYSLRLTCPRGEQFAQPIIIMNTFIRHWSLQSCRILTTSGKSSSMILLICEWYIQ